MIFSKRVFIDVLIFCLLVAAILFFAHPSFAKAKVLIPPGGVWTVYSNAGNLTCPSYSKTVPAEPTVEATLTVTDGGATIKFVSPHGTGTLTRKLKGPHGAQYVGPITNPQTTVMMDLLYTDFKGNSEMLGEMTREPSPGCKFVRGVHMEWSKAKVKIQSVVK